MVKPSISLETTISREERKRRNDRTLVKIYKASLDNDKWINITELPDSDNYSTAHPILSPDENTLFLICRAL
jgi:hypothetical protein